MVEPGTRTRLHTRGTFQQIGAHLPSLCTLGCWHCGALGTWRTDAEPPRLRI